MFGSRCEIVFSRRPGMKTSTCNEPNDREAAELVSPPGGD